MMQNHVRSHVRLAGAAALAIAQLAVTACDKMPLTAPSGGSVSLTSAALVLPIGGSTEVSAFVAESSGTPVQNGTMVRFTTNLGRVDPVEAHTNNGRAVTTFFAGDVSGVAQVRATSGSVVSAPIGSGGGGTGTTGSPSIDISIGAAAVDAVVLRASQLAVPFNGGTVDLTATVTGVGGRLLAGVPVAFLTTEGQLSVTSGVTDAAGEVRTSLTTNRPANVTATSGTKTSNVVAIVRREAPPVTSVTLAATPGATTVGVGQTFTFVATVTVTGGETNEARPVSYRWDFGDGTSATTSGNTITHVYTTPTTRHTVTVEVSMSNGQTVSAQTEIITGVF
jgi:hypothetical protein